MFVTQISVFLSNSTGKLAEITEILSKSNINIRALSLADTSDYGILRLIVDDPTSALKVLKDSCITVRETQVIAAKLPDVPGSLAKVLKILDDSNEPVLYAYAFISPVGTGACVILRTNDKEKAASLLLQHNVCLISAEEMHGKK